LSAATQPFVGQIATPGIAGRVVLPIPNPDMEAEVAVWGPYTSLQLVVQASYDAGQNWFTIGPPIRRDTLLADGNIALQPDGITLAVFPAVPGSNQLWTYALPPRVNALSAYAPLLVGVLNVRLSTGTFFANAPGGQALTLGGLMIYQLLMQLVLSVQDLKGPSGGRPPSGLSADFASGVIRLPQ